MALFPRFLLAIVLVVSGAAWAQGAAELSSYKLGIGDLVTIRVLGEPELVREKVRLTDAGTISFPVLGEIRVKGLTVGALEESIANALKGRYLLDPKVNVTLEEYRHYFVTGLVGKPGPYPYVPGLTVLKAITIAGGFTERAARDKTNIIRDGDSAQQRHRVDLSAPVYPGDILTVEESFF